MLLHTTIFHLILCVMITTTATALKQEEKQLIDKRESNVNKGTSVEEIDHQLAKRTFLLPLGYALGQSWSGRRLPPPPPPQQSQQYQVFNIPNTGSPTDFPPNPNVDNIPLTFLQGSNPNGNPVPGAFNPNNPLGNSFNNPIGNPSSNVFNNPNGYNPLGNAFNNPNGYNPLGNAFNNPNGYNPLGNQFNQLNPGGPNPFQPFNPTGQNPLVKNLLAPDQNPLNPANQFNPAGQNPLIKNLLPTTGQNPINPQTGLPLFPTNPITGLPTTGQNPINPQTGLPLFPTSPLGGIPNLPSNLDPNSLQLLLAQLLQPQQAQSNAQQSNALGDVLSRLVGGLGGSVQDLLKSLAGNNNPAPQPPTPTPTNTLPFNPING